MLKPSFLTLAFVLILGSGVQAGVDPSLVGWWQFEEGSGTTVGDSSGKDHHGTIQGTPEWGPGPEGFGTAVGFSNTQGAYCTAFDPTGGTGTFTMALWCNWDGTQSIQHFVTKSNGWGADTAMFQIEVKGGHADPARVDRLHLAYQAAPQAVLNLVPHNEWVHLALAFDGTYATGYRNGIDDVGPQPTGIGPNVDAPIIVGASHAAEGRTFQGFLDDVRLYSRVLTEAEVQALMRPVPPGAASEPTPSDQASDVPRSVTLEWTAGEFAAAHDVYLGTVFEDVNAAGRADPRDVLVSEGRTDTAYDAGRLEFGQTYYWRIDEVNAAPDNAIYRGAVWSFTVEPLAYPIENIAASSNGSSDAGAGPEKTVDGSGLNAEGGHSVDADDMWLAVPGADPLWIQYEFDNVYKLHEMLVWNYNVMFEPVLGFGLKDVTVAHSIDGADWTVLGDAELAQGTALPDYRANTAVDFGGVAAKHVRLTVNSGHGPMGQFGLSEVRFTFVPVQAREPQPDDGETAVSVDAALAWRAGREAAAHDVYLGTAADALTLLDTVTTSNYTPADLEFGTTYHWRIDEVNEAEAIPVWESNVWNFSTLDYAVIDDMESYDDEENTIFDTWLDGFVNGTGSTVGYFEAPFAETTIVHGGGQSMPLQYDNSAAPFYSEAELDVGSANWNTNGADRLRLFVYGQAPAFFEAADGTILMNGIGNDIWDSSDQFRYAYKTLTGNGSLTARVDALDGSPNSWAKGGVMIRQNIEGGAVNAFMALTGGDGGGATYQQRVTANGSSVSQHTYADGPFAPPYWVRVTREGNTLLGYTSPDGQTWTQRGDSVSLAMTDPVLIGLALTSHNVDQATSATFSNVSATGNVGASWQMAEIGATQPTGNDVAPLYLALEDTSGNVAVATHPDASIVAQSGWHEWLIPYGELAGANLGRIAIMYIGVGDRNNPSADGTGTVFIDDIGYGKAASAD